MQEHMSNRQTGATAVEYALMVALVFLVIVAAVTALGVQVSALFANAAALIP